MTSFFKSYHTFMIKHILNFRHGRQTVDTDNHSIFLHHLISCTGSKMNSAKKNCICYNANRQEMSKLFPL